MKVDVTPVLKSRIFADDFDIKSLTGIILKELPPVCPFCGAYMKKKGCSCTEFKTAYHLLLKKLNLSEDVPFSFGYPGGESMEIVTPVSPEQVFVETLPAENCTVSLFTGGKMNQEFEFLWRNIRIRG